jgi:Dockerin type I domain
MKFKEIGAAVFIALAVLMSFSVLMARASVPGDVNGDGLVNIADVAAAAAVFGKRLGDTGFNPAADVNADGVVNILDLVFILVHYTP